MRRLWWLPLALTTACGPASVSGVVDGDRIGGARDAIYDTLELDFGVFGEVNAMAIIVTDFPNSCEVFEAFFETIEPDCDDRCDEYRGIAEEFLGGRDYWALSLVLISGGSYEDTYDYEPDQIGEDEFQLVFNKYDTEPLYEASTCEDACEDAELLVPDVENGNGGELEILVEDGDIVKGRFDVDMGGEEDLRGSFTATECNMAEWLPWL